jgi:hypothetical protein
MSRINNHGAISLFLFLILIGLYGLSFNGVAVTDDEQLFASAAISLAQNGDLSAPQLSGNDRLEGIYSGVGPLHPVIGALLLYFIPIKSIGSVQLLFLLAPLYTAMTGILIFKLANLLGYPLQTAIFAVLAFGLSTIAWPYSKTFFREPLAMLMVMVVWFSFEVIVARNSENYKKMVGLAGFCLAIAGLLFTKIQLLAVLPLFGLIGMWKLASDRKKIKLSKPLLVGGLALGLISFTMVYFLLNRSLPVNIPNRVSMSFLEFAWRRILATPHAAFWEAIMGAMFSTGKGFFWYSPIALLALFSIFVGVGLQKREVYLPWLAFMALLVTQALAYDEDWWNITWSTRFLLPTLPLMVVAALPALNKFLSSDKRYYRLIPLVFFFFGIFIQLSTVLISDITHLIQLYQKYGTVYPEPIIWGLGTIPLVGHVRMILEGTKWDLILWRSFEGHPAEVLTSALILVGICVIGIVGLLKKLYGWKINISPSTSIFLSCVTILLIGSIILNIAKDDNQYYAGREDFALANDWITQNINQGDAILVDAYLDPVWYYLWNFGKANLPIYSFPNRDSRSRSALISLSSKPSSEGLYHLLEKRDRRIWLVCEKKCAQQVVYLMGRTMAANPLQDILFFDSRTKSQTEVILFKIEGGGY